MDDDDVKIYVPVSSGPSVSPETESEEVRVYRSGS